MSWDIIWTILYGAICGYVASRILGGDGFGFLGNIVVGILGGILGSWLIKEFKVPMISGAIGNFVSSVGGAIVLIVVLEILRSIGSYSKSSRK
jgi:uncharacterized membrane protein YeaQ/YmgE (transglycosylase-associated protein family)